MTHYIRLREPTIARLRLGYGPEVCWPSLAMICSLERFMASLLVTRSLPKYTSKRRHLWFIVNRHYQRWVCDPQLVQAKPSVP